MNIGIIGSRRRNTFFDFIAVKRTFLKFLKDQEIPITSVTIVSGGCPQGGDHFAEQIAKDFNIPTIIFKAEWDKYGKSAGFRRNGIIAANSNILIACRAADHTGGTEDTITKFLNIKGEFGILIEA